MKRAVVLAVAAGLLASGSALAGEIKERTTFFMVKGSTFRELDQALGLKGPLLGGGERRAGATEVAFDGNVTYKPGNGSCGIDRAAFRLNLHTTLPRWSAPRSATSETKILWKTLRDDIVTHEAQHASIAKSWLKRIESSVKALPRQASCATMEQTVNAATRRLLLQHERAQRDFDAAEARKIDARLKRELDVNMGRVAAR